MAARWEGDERGQGVGDGSRLSGGIAEVLSLASTTNWVAEAPELHLLPHLRAACEEPGSFFALESTQTDPDGSFLVNLRADDPSAGEGEIRANAYALIGRVAETATYIRQRREALIFEVLTGIPAGDGLFSTHGHLLILRVVGTRSA
jgi:hypothetical protein